MARTRRMRACGAGLTLLAVCLCTSGCGGPAKMAAVDLWGKSVRPLESTNSVGTVLVFEGIECPISNKYAPELQRLSQRFAPRRIQFWFVYPDKDADLPSIRRHAQDFGLGERVLWDPQHSLVKMARAETTPEAAVFSRSGALLYRGQIDDRFVALGSERSQVAHRYLEDVLQALVSGRDIPWKQTKAVGCPIGD